MRKKEWKPRSGDRYIAVMPAVHAKKRSAAPFGGFHSFALFALGLTPQAKNLSRLRRFSSSRSFDEAAVNSQMSTNLSLYPASCILHPASICGYAALSISTTSRCSGSRPRIALVIRRNRSEASVSCMWTSPCLPCEVSMSSA